MGTDTNSYELRPSPQTCILNTTLMQSKVPTKLASTSFNIGNGYRADLLRRNRSQYNHDRCNTASHPKLGRESLNAWLYSRMGPCLARMGVLSLMSFHGEFFPSTIHVSTSFVHGRSDLHRHADSINNNKKHRPARSPIAQTKWLTETWPTPSIRHLIGPVPPRMGV